MLGPHLASAALSLLLCLFMIKCEKYFLFQRNLNKSWLLGDRLKKNGERIQLSGALKFGPKIH